MGYRVNFEPSHSGIYPFSVGVKNEGPMGGGAGSSGFCPEEVLVSVVRMMFHDVDEADDNDRGTHASELLAAAGYSSQTGDGDGERRDELWAIAEEGVSAARCFLDAYKNNGPQGDFPGTPQWLMSRELLDTWDSFLERTRKGATR